MEITPSLVDDLVAYAVSWINTFEVTTDNDWLVLWHPTGYEEWNYTVLEIIGVSQYSEFPIRYNEELGDCFMQWSKMK